MSLRWRITILVGAILACACILLPNLVDRERLPWPLSRFKPLGLGLDLQGGSHIVYSIDLDRAVDDRAAEIRRDLESRYAADGAMTHKPVVKAPSSPVGAITVIAPDDMDRSALVTQIHGDYGETIEDCECAEGDGPHAICVRVSTSFADGIKKAALANAVNTIRDRIDEKGVAEPTVVQQGEQIVVELPGLDDDRKQQTRDLIARTAKLEFKVVDDGSIVTDDSGRVTSRTNGRGSALMARLYVRVGELDKNEALASDAQEGDPTDPVAKQLGVYAMRDYWPVEDQPDRPHSDYYLKAYDKTAVPTPLDEARRIECYKPSDEGVKPVIAGQVACDLKGWQVIDRFLADLAARDASFKVPDDHQIGYELEEPSDGKRPYWRSYYLYRAVRLTGTAIANAMPSFEPTTGRAVVLLDFNRFGGRVFGDLTAEIVGMKLATILDDRVKSAPIINGAIRGGRASITMGGADPRRAEAERDELVNVLKTGSLPAPLHEEAVSDLGPTLGRDAIEKTQVSFLMGVVLVVIIMVAFYRKSGWVAVFAVLFHVVVTLAVMALFEATLTLPGIAALVLSVGMCVDGNILINERIRDELLLGKSVRGAVDLGFSRAFSAIVDGQLTIAASSFVLLGYGSGPIKGFAVMMLVGVFTTVATNTWVTRILFDWRVGRDKTARTLSI